MADNLLVRRFKNTGTVPSTVDFWVYDLDYSHNSPVAVYIDVLEKVTTDSVLATYRKESRGVKHKKDVPAPIAQAVHKVTTKAIRDKSPKPTKKVEKKKVQKKPAKLIKKSSTKILKKKPVEKKKDKPIKSTKKNINKVFNQFFGD